jgi:hypothetical protein
VHQLPIKSSIWSETRFCDLAAQMKWGHAETLGVLVMLWSQTRDWRRGDVLTQEQVLAAISCPREVRGRAMGAMQDTGYLAPTEGGWRVVDNDQYFAVSAKMREAGKQGGYHKHKAHPTKRIAKLKALKPPSASSKAWDAYAEAYRTRYGVDPKRNAQVNGQMAKLVACVGQDDAAPLAAWYVQHNSTFYVRTQHPVGALLKDHSGLYTQMLRGRAMTEHDVRAVSEGGALKAQLQRLSAGG